MMKNGNAYFISLTSFVLLAALPQLSSASDSWSGFVPPSSVQLNVELSAKQSKWHKAAWRTGANFQRHGDMRYMNASPNIVDAKEYALTQPQRKSVNPWQVKKTWAQKKYTFAPNIRPWGSVPEQFQRRSGARPVYQMHAVNRFAPAVRNYRPYANHYAFNSSNSLLPVGGYLPIYPNSSYGNRMPFLTSPYGNMNGFPWR